MKYILEALAAGSFVVFITWVIVVLIFLGVHELLKFFGYQQNDKWHLTTRQMAGALTGPVTILFGSASYLIGAAITG